MITYPLNGYYNRYDPAKRYEKHLIRAGKGVQSAEINEIQEAFLDRTRGIADALFKDGDIVRDCQAVVDGTTGAVQMEGGALYLRGAVRGVAPASFTVPVNIDIQIGIRLVENVVTELEDPALRDPASGTRNQDEPGAGRLQVVCTWGWNGDGAPGAFYGVYTVEHGVLLPKEPPPSFDALTVSIARYDRDSAGGNYIVNGLPVSASYNRTSQEVTVLVGEGRARVNGYPIELARSLRTIYAADPDLKAIQAEPETFSPGGGGTMRVNLDNSPMVSLQQVRVTAQKQDTLTHGAFSGAADPLPENSILAIVAVNQGGTWNGTTFVGGTTYVQGTDYKLTSGDVDWSLSGAEPAPGSSYKVVYQYQSTTAGVVTAVDDTGFTLGGPIVPGTIVTVDYTFAMPRIDALTLDADGRLNRIKGVASQYRPAEPSIPTEQLRIAGLRHDWFGDPVVEADAVVVMPMAELQGMRAMVFDLFDLVAQERLRNSVALADPAAKRGVFVDPFTNDNLRDSGISQSLAIIDGELRLAIAPAVNAVGTDITAPQLLPYVLETVIEQPYRTGSMKINPYQAFDPIPGTMALAPPVDFWTEVNTVWSSPITRRFSNGVGGRVVNTTTTTGVEVVGATETNAQFIRQRSVGFTIQGFGPGETLQTLTFDGIAVTPENP